MKVHFIKYCSCSIVCLSIKKLVHIFFICFMIKPTGLTANLSSSLSSLNDEMTTLRTKINSIEPVVEKLNKDVEGMCEPFSKSYGF